MIVKDEKTGEFVEVTGYIPTCDSVQSFVFYVEIVFNDGSLTYRCERDITYSI